jgi:transposase
MTILTVGIDLAKNVFAVHGINEAGKAALVRPAVPRDKLHALIAALPPCVIGALLHNPEQRAGGRAVK